MSQNSSELQPENLEVAPDVALFIESLDPVQRTFFIRAIAPSQFNLTVLWDALGDWWNGQEPRERLALITQSFNRYYQGREKQDDSQINSEG